MTTGAASWFRSTGSAAIAALLVLFVAWLAGFADVKTLASEAKTEADWHEKRIVSIEASAAGASLVAANAAKEAADHEVRMRAVETATTEMRINLQWIRDAISTGRDPRTGAPLPK